VAYKCCILLGRVIKVSGYEGAVIVKLDKILPENIPQMESVFLEVEGRPVPFFISLFEYSGTDILKLGFEGYCSDKKISEFIGCRVFLTETINNEYQSENNLDLAGYDVYDQNDILLGSVSELITNRRQLLLNVISMKKKSILIPFHEHFIVRIDKKKKIIVMEIPEGLADIN
jgi:16S rRNA processing protein RimM